jgi:Uma2 family endonuclease
MEVKHFLSRRRVEAIMSTVTTQTRYTPEDLLKMPDGDHYELVDGQLVEQPMSTWAGYLAVEISSRLRDYCRPKQLGWVLSETAGYQCFSDAPSKVLRPDVSFIRLGRLSVDQSMEEGHILIPPDLAVEVVSPNDLDYEVQRKVEEYLKAGVRLVWVVNPQTHKVQVHRATGPGTILRESDDLDGEDVIPGFRCPIQDLFQPPIGVTEGTK